MAEIGKVIGVCESRVSQLRSLALSRLRASMRDALGDLTPMSQSSRRKRSTRCSTSASDQAAASRRSRAISGASVVGYNFRRPDRVTKDQIRSLHFLHDRFARNVSTSLSAYLRVVTDVTILSVEQFTYSEFLMSLPDPTAFYADLDAAARRASAALELNPSVAFTMIDRMLGGSGRGVAVNRALTEIEQNVTDGVVKLILENLTDAWRGIVDVQFRITGRETRPQMLQVAAPNEVVLLIGFEIRIGDTRGVLEHLLPGREHRGGERQLHPLVAADAARDDAGRAGRARRERRPRRRHAVGRDRRRIGAGEFLRLQVGDVVGLEHPAAEPIEVQRQRQGQVHRGAGRCRRPARTSGSTDPSARPGPTPPEAPHVPTRPRARPGPLHPVRRRDAVRRHRRGRGPAVRRRGRARLAGAVRAGRPDRRHVRTSPSPATTPPAPGVARADEGDGVARRNRRGAEGADGAGAVAASASTRPSPAWRPASASRRRRRSRRGTAAGSFACRLDEASTLYFGCSYRRRFGACRPVRRRQRRRQRASPPRPRRRRARRRTTSS